MELADFIFVYILKTLKIKCTSAYLNWLGITSLFLKLLVHFFFWLDAN